MEYVKSVGHLSYITKDILDRWTKALEPLNEQSSKQSNDQWFSKLDVETLKEILRYIVSKENELENKLPKELVGLSGLSKNSAVVMCGIRTLQREHLGKVNMNAHKYNVIKRKISKVDTREPLPINTFERLREYLNKMTMRANYQAVVVKLLLNKDGAASRNDIAKELENHNASNPEKDFRYVEVFRVLERNKVVRRDGNKFILNVKNIKTNEVKDLISICDDRLIPFSTKPAVNGNNNGIFITFFSRDNLLISEQLGLLGWKEELEDLQPGSLVFVYVTKEHIIASCFEIKDKSKVSNYIWKEEMEQNKIIYKYRWNAYPRANSINISLEEIRNLPPFDAQRFTAFLRTRKPIPLKSEKYGEFCRYLLKEVTKEENIRSKMATYKKLQKISEGEIESAIKNDPVIIKEILVSENQVIIDSRKGQNANKETNPGELRGKVCYVWNI